MTVVYQDTSTSLTGDVQVCLAHKLQYKDSGINFEEHNETDQWVMGFLVVLINGTVFLVKILYSSRGRIRAVSKLLDVVINV